MTGRKTGRPPFRAYTVEPPEGMRPVCGQCRRDVEAEPWHPGQWRHCDDKTPRCPMGLADAAVAVLTRLPMRFAKDAGD